MPSGEAASAAPALAVASRRRREIDPDLETLFDIGCFPLLGYLLFVLTLFGFGFGVPRQIRPKPVRIT
jgi:hypothetical protein